MKKFSSFIILISLFINQLSAQDTICGTKVRIVGYQPSWEGMVSFIQFNKLTDVIYAFALPNSNGTLQTLDNPLYLDSIVTAAHNSKPRVNVLIFYVFYTNFFSNRTN